MLNYKKLFFSILILILILFSNCGNKDRNRVSDAQALGAYSAGVNPDTMKPTVFAKPEGGAYGESQFVDLWANKGPVKIYYTINGDKPTQKEENLYTPGSYIEVTKDLTLRYFAIDEAKNISLIKAEEYIILQDEETVSYQPPTTSGYTNPITVRFYPDDGLKVYYTLDQKDPKTDGTLYRSKDDACDIVSDDNCPAEGFYARSNIYLSSTTMVRFVVQKPTGEFMSVTNLEYFVSDGGDVGKSGNMNLTYEELVGFSRPVQMDKEALNSLPLKIRRSMKIMDLNMETQGILVNTLESIKCGPNAVFDGNASFTNCSAFTEGTPELNLQRLLNMNSVNADISGSSIEELIDITSILGLEGGSVGFLQKLMKTENENDPFLPASRVESAIIDFLIKPHPLTTNDGTMIIYLEDGLTDMSTLADRLSMSDQNADGIEDNTGKKIVFYFNDFVDNSKVDGDAGYNTPDGLDDISNCPNDLDGGSLEDGDVITDSPQSFDFNTKCSNYPVSKGGAAHGLGIYEYKPYYGFLDPTKITYSEVMTDDFVMKLTATINGTAKKGYDFSSKVVLNAFPFDADEIDFDSTSLTIEGLADGDLTMDMGFRMIEFPADFSKIGDRRLDFASDTFETGKGTSGVWDIDSYYLEYIIMNASYIHLRSMYRDDDVMSPDDDPVHEKYCGGGTSDPSCFVVAEVWAGYKSLWETTAIPYALDGDTSITQDDMYKYMAPGPYIYMESVVDPPQMGFYLHDLLSFVANRRMHDSPYGTIPEGEANISLQLNNISLNMNAADVTAKIENQLFTPAGKEALQATSAAMFASDSGQIADIFIEKNPGYNKATRLADHSQCSGASDTEYYDNDNNVCLPDSAFNFSGDLLYPAASYPYMLVFKASNLTDWKCQNIDSSLPECSGRSDDGKLYDENMLQFYTDFNLTETAKNRQIIFIPKDKEDPFYSNDNNYFYLKVVDNEQYRLRINASNNEDDSYINIDWVRMK